MVYSVKCFRDVQKYYSYKSFVPLVKTVKKKGLGRMGRTEARLIWGREGCWSLGERTVDSGRVSLAAC